MGEVEQFPVLGFDLGVGWQVAQQHAAVRQGQFVVFALTQVADAGQALGAQAAADAGLAGGAGGGVGGAALTGGVFRAQIVGCLGGLSLGQQAGGLGAPRGVGGDADQGAAQVVCRHPRLAGSKQEAGVIQRRSQSRGARLLVGLALFNPVCRQGLAARQAGGDQQDGDDGARHALAREPPNRRPAGRCGHCCCSLSARSRMVAESRKKILRLSS